MAQIKSTREIKLLKKAADITNDIFRCVSKKVKPGVRESEIVAETEAIIKKKGLKRSFPTIVASGPNAAKPHAKVTERKIKTNDVVVFDFGVIYKGYHSDMTRTIIVGKIDRKLKLLYQTVKKAQKVAIEKVRSGIKASDLAREAHDFMRKKGFGKYILHTLGHGIGMKVHEAPKLSEKNRHILKKNMVCTIEPGLYIKNKGGIRIEDMVLITEKGCQVLTR